jgi:hypothetical protein
VLATKGYVKFLRDGTSLGLPFTRSKFGYLVVENMILRAAEETVDAETGEVCRVPRPVLPSHFRCPQSGAVLPVENPDVWVRHDGSDAA